MRRLINNDPRIEQRRQARLLAIMERRFRRLLAAEIRRATLAMLAQYEATGAAPRLPEDHERRIEDIYRQMAEVGIETFGERIVSQGKHAGLILERKSFVEFFRRLALQYIGLEMIRRRITSVTETTRQQIVNQITAGQNAGEGIAAIAKRISDNVGIISRQRGALIARTETHGAANYGADGAARATGLKLRKEWVAAGELPESEGGRTRDDHWEADGQIVDMDQAFEVGGEMLMYPGDPAGSAGNVINCRCAISHVVDDGID
jgi:uncharacterized protein with gpF-like domain